MSLLVVNGIEKTISGIFVRVASGCKLSGVAL